MPALLPRDEAQMLGAKERLRLVERYARDEPRPLVAVVKCVVGLVALCAVAAAPWFLVSSGGAGVMEAHAITGAPAAFPSSMAESKRIFDERRSRYEARTPPKQGTALARELDAAAAPGAEATGHRGPMIP